MSYYIVSSPYYVSTPQSHYSGNGHYAINHYARPNNLSVNIHISMNNGQGYYVNHGLPRLGIEIPVRNLQNAVIRGPF